MLIMVINCFVIDDEPLARKGLKEYIADVDFLQLSAEGENPLSAADMLQQVEQPLMFLDIQMPKISGLDFVKSLQSPPPVIFTTAYPQFALDGYDLNALDYLVKPISFERFLKAAYKAKEYYEVRQKNKTNNNEVAPRDYMFIKADNKLVKISYDDILFIEALQNYVVIYTPLKKFISYLTFKSVEEFLPANRFIKTHKSFIVSIARTESIEGNEIAIGTHRIPLSRNTKDEVIEKIMKGNFLKR